MLGRIDDTKYQTGLSTCRNFIVTPQGPIENRPGFGFVREVKVSSLRVKLIPFTYSTTQTMVIELGAGYFRFHTLGATLMNGNVPYEIPNPYAEADLFDIHTVQSADVLTLVHPNHAPRELRRLGALSWQLSEIDFWPPINAPEGVTATAAGHTEEKYTYAYRVSSIHVDGISESSASSPVSVSGNLYETGATVTVSWTAVTGASRYNVYKLQGGLYGYIGQTEGLSIVDDDIDPDLSTTPPIYDNPFAGDGILSVTVTNGGAGYGTQPDGGGIGSVVIFDFDYGQYYSNNLAVSIVDTHGQGAIIHVDGRSAGMEYALSKLPEIAGNPYTGDRTVTGKPTPFKFTINEPGRGYVNPTITLHDNGGTRVNEAGQYEAVKGPDIPLQYTLTPVISTVEVKVLDPSGTGAVIEAIVSGGQITGIRVLAPGMGYTNPSIVVSRPLGGAGASFSVQTTSNRDFPGAVSYFEQRRCFAGTPTKPQHIWMTKSGTESNMSYSLPIRDDDRIAFRVAAREANTIRHIVPLSQLILLTAAAEWRVTSLNSDAITPSTISVRPQSYVGASNVQPVIVNNSLVYAAARGGHVRELGYNWQANGFITADLSLRAPQLFDSLDIVDMAFAKAPYPVVWCVSSNGKLLGLTYVPEQQVGAWHWHDTDGAFESCAVVAEGHEDVLYCVIRREINGATVRTIERLASRQFVDQEDAFFVDCGLSYRGEPATTISGLSHLEGKTVAILAEGSVHPKRVVTNGQITLDHPARVAHVGLPITADAQTLPVAMMLQDGSFGQGHTKNVNKAWMRVSRSSGIFIGPDVDRLVEVKQRTDEAYGAPVRLKSEEMPIVLKPSWGDSGQVCVRQADPLPLTLVSLTLEITVGG